MPAISLLSIFVIFFLFLPGIVLRRIYCYKKYSSFSTRENSVKEIMITLSTGCLLQGMHLFINESGAIAWILVVSILFLKIYEKYIIRNFYNKEIERKKQADYKWSLEKFIFNIGHIGIVLVLLLIIFLNYLYSFPYDLSYFGNWLNEPKSHTHNVIYNTIYNEIAAQQKTTIDDLSKIFVFNLAVLVDVALLGFFARFIVRSYLFALDRKTIAFRFDNFWYYLFSGEILQFYESGKNANFMQRLYMQFNGKSSLSVNLNILVKIDKEFFIYKGLLHSYHLSKDLKLEYIVLQDIKKKIISYNQVRNSSKVIEEIAVNIDNKQSNSTKKETGKEYADANTVEYTMEETHLIIPKEQIQNITVKYYLIREE